MDTKVTAKMKIRKPANEVFEAIVNPEKMGNYWFSTGTGRLEEGQTVTWRYEEYGAEGKVHVLELETAKKIVFNWGEPEAETTVTMNFLEEEDSAIVEVIEAGLKEDDPYLVQKMMGQTGGWIYMLSCLKAYLEHGISDLRASLIH
ncbi:hypothetical protein AM500_19870 [Bacillus sp. FJAT-18017]|uniref:SRPBCC family protein n=1 Tax=Bacillus sp. FJAT-18017 TaxID=1705566 RepID=UPI0006ADA4E3|nr:SRPBCC family protein [Bacillus sp. FJAT-18017]ALC91789.1 hypothetical protein AM500_19870 [Bacillus sp. FJAT-18017]